MDQQRLNQKFQDSLRSYEYRDQESCDEWDVECASGCFMFARTTALKSINGFDERYFLYFEDFDLTMRLKLLGRIKQVSRVQIIHNGGAAAKKGWRHLLYFAASCIRFFNSHGWKYH